MRRVAKRSTKKKFCMHSACKNEAFTDGFCRLHYISNWKHIKFNRKVKAERRLNAYVDLISKRYPKDYLEKIKESLESEEKFQNTIEELDFDSTKATVDESEKEYMERFLRKIKGTE